MQQILEYIDKVSKLLKRSQQYIPYSLLTFYTVLKSATNQIKQTDISLQLVNHYSNIYKFLRNWTEEPLTTPKQRDNIFPDLKKFFLPLRKFMPNDQNNSSFLKNFDDILTYRKVAEMRENAEKKIQELKKKNNPVHISGNTEYAIAFWVNNFMSDYAVHFDMFWRAFLNMNKQLPFYQKFVSQSSKRAIKQIVDPQNIYYVGMAAINDLVHALSEPEVLTRFAQLTAKGYKQPIFQSKHQLKLKFLNETQIETKLKNQDVIILSGEQVLIGDEVIKCKYPPTIRFGSSVDADVMIKHKFVSRRQFMLIQQQYTGNQEQNGYFSLICLSPSNYTCVCYARNYELSIGTLFKVGQEIVQVLKIQNKFQNSYQSNQTHQNFNLTEYEKTLEYLPQNQSCMMGKYLEYKVLSGQSKNLKQQIDIEHNYIKINGQQIEIIIQNNRFYIPPKTQILLKNANQVLSGHLSHKIMLQSGMSIILQKCCFVVI